LIVIDVLNISNGIIEGRLGQGAGLLGVVQALVVEDREVEGQSQSDGVGGLQLSVGDLRGSRVGLQGTLRDLFMQISLGVLRDVSEVVSLHLQVEDLRLGGGGLLNKLLIQKVKNVLAISRQLVFEFLFILSDQWQVARSLALFFLLDGRNSSPSGSSGSNGVLVGNGEEVSLFDGQFLVEVVNDLLDVVEHVFEPLGLLADLGHVNGLFS